MHHPDDPALWVFRPQTPDECTPYMPALAAPPEDATPCYCAGCAEKYLAIEVFADAFTILRDVDASGSAHAEQRARSARAWQTIGWWGRWRRLWWAIGVDLSAHTALAGDDSAMPMPRRWPVNTPRHRLHSRETSQISWLVDEAIQRSVGDGAIWLDSIEVWPAYDVAVERVIVDDLIVAGAGAGTTLPRHILQRLGGGGDTLQGGRREFPPFIVRRYIALSVRNDSGIPIDDVSADIVLRVVPRVVHLFRWRRRHNGDACSCTTDHTGPCPGTATTESVARLLR